MFYQFNKKKNMSAAEITGFVLAFVLLYFILVGTMALFTNYAMTRFNAEWTDFWGWAAIYAIAPIIRVWVSNRGN